MIEYEGSIYRPPSEGRSVIFQRSGNVTRSG